MTSASKNALNLTNLKILMPKVTKKCTNFYHKVF